MAELVGVTSLVLLKLVGVHVDLMKVRDLALLVSLGPVDI